ncbi:protein NYNRIN-like isoform X2 [Ascaphus truei]
MEMAYKYLRSALCSAPALGLPNYQQPFHLYCTEGGAKVAGVLAQEHGGGYRPVAFYSKTFPTVVQGMPACLRAVAACAIMTETAQTIVLSHPLTLHTSHQVLQILNNLTTQHMTAQRRSGYETILTTTANLTVKYHPSHSGPAVLLHRLLSNTEPDSDHEHDCLTNITLESSPRCDLSSVPLPYGEVVFVDGSCSKPADGVFLTGFSVVQLPDTVLMAYSLPFVSAQAAEIIALTKDFKLFKDREVTIYTDSRYAFGVAHDFGVIWQHRGFTTADGKGIAHSQLIEDILAAILLPLSLAIVKCKGHSSDGSDVAKGNDLADIVARNVAISAPFCPDYDTTPFFQMSLINVPSIPDFDLISLQALASEEDLAFWKQEGLTLDVQHLLSDKEGRVGVPKTAAPIFISHFHGFGHIGRKQTCKNIRSRFCIRDLSVLVETQLSRCLTCARNNPNGAIHGVHEHLPPPDGPMQQLQIDFTHMPKAKGGLQYLLVIVDQFSKWVEAFPTSKENTSVVAKILCKEIIPRFGCPLSINSDQGTPFTAKITQQICQMLCIDWKFHVP